LCFAVVHRSPSINVGVNDDDFWTSDQAHPAKRPWGMLVAVGVNGAIDGLTVALTYIAGGAAGLITSIAICIEQCLLGVAMCKTLRVTFSPQATLFLVITLPLPILIVGIVAGTALSGLTGSLYTGLISFGVAGLVYLVTEELMVEAHHNHDTDKWYVSVMFFVGFLFVVVLDEVVPTDF